MRGWLARQELQKKEKAAIVVQKAFRGYLEKKAELKAEEKQEEEEEEYPEFDLHVSLTPRKVAEDDHGDTGMYCA